MTQAGDRAFDDVVSEADAVEQLTPVGVDDDEYATLDAVRVRISTHADASEADLIEQAMVVPVDDELDFDR
ncbi:hypothetical protein [Mycolicibacterium wolinskyi]|uniref:hypothetical protein n=1 Tax=Mycolicibacterium wolinskyi TaxID=59750 RepID=UPI0039178750